MRPFLGIKISTTLIRPGSAVVLAAFFAFFALTVFGALTALDARIVLDAEDVAEEDAAVAVEDAAAVNCSRRSCEKDWSCPSQGSSIFKWFKVQQAERDRSISL